MMNGKSANFDRRLTKLENTKLGVAANLAGFRIPKIIVHEGDDVDQIIKDMEARGEIPTPPADFPAGHIRAIVHTIVDWPKRNADIKGRF
jgi:hypothetical protein